MILVKIKTRGDWSWTKDPNYAVYGKENYIVTSQDVNFQNIYNFVGLNS